MKAVSFFALNLKGLSREIFEMSFTVLKTKSIFIGFRCFRKKLALMILYLIKLNSSLLDNV